MAEDDAHEAAPWITREVEENTNTTSDLERPTCWLRTKTFLRSITVEPALSMILFGIGMETVFITNLWVDKICYFHFNYSKIVCENIDSGKYPEEQNNVQQVTNQYNVYTHLLQYLPAVVVVLLLGTWSDLKGRKLPVIIPFLGYFLTSLSVMAVSYWWFLPPEYLLACYVPLAFTGGLIGIYSGIYPYLSAVTSGRGRTSRISLIGVVITASATFGQAMALPVFKHGGYIAVFGCQAALSAAAILYSILRLVDKPGSDALREISEEEEGVLRVLSPSRLKQTLLVTFKMREGGKRGDILGHIAVMLLLVFVGGSYNYNFLYTRKKFSWDYKAFSLYSAVDTPVSAIGTLVILPVLSYWWGVEDAILGFMGGVSLLFSNVLKATAPEPWVLYLASAVGFCIGQVTAASRGALSKLVSKSEVGAVFAMLAAGESIIPMISAFVYTTVYNATINFFPGMIYVLSSILSVAMCCMYVRIMTRNR